MPPLSPTVCHSRGSPPPAQGSLAPGVATAQAVLCGLPLPRALGQRGTISLWAPFSHLSVGAAFLLPARSP